MRSTHLTYGGLGVTPVAFTKLLIEPEWTRRWSRWGNAYDALAESQFGLSKPE